jgi:hypothetical protein
VSGALLKQDARFAGQIIAHELGHALGLFHTSEAPLRPASHGSGGEGREGIYDGLADTAMCSATADKNGDGVLSSNECRGDDARNLMFWGTPRGATDLTPQQADIAVRSLLTR